MGASQIDEGVTFNVAGGLMLEHPLTLPFVDAVVSYVIFSRTITLRSLCLHIKTSHLENRIPCTVKTGMEPLAAKPR